MRGTCKVNKTQVLNWVKHLFTHMWHIPLSVLILTFFIWCFIELIYFFRFFFLFNEIEWLQARPIAHIGCLTLSTFTRSYAEAAFILFQLTSTLTITICVSVVSSEYMYNLLNRYEESAFVIFNWTINCACMRSGEHYAKEIMYKKYFLQTFQNGKSRFASMHVYVPEIIFQHKKKQKQIKYCRLFARRLNRTEYVIFHNANFVSRSFSACRQSATFNNLNYLLNTVFCF